MKIAHISKPSTIIGMLMCFSVPSDSHIVKSGNKSAAAPVQIHLALGLNPSIMAVSWSTYDDALPGAGSVEWSLSKDLANSESAQGDVRAFTVDEGRVWYTHAANMTGLKPSTRYYYQVKSASGDVSKIYTFRSQPDSSTIESTLPESHIIYGDMGAADAFTLCSACSGKTPVCDATTCASAKQNAGLISEISSASIIVHTGDFAYDLDTNNGLIGDQFMANIEQIAAYVPYMPSVGNHEDNPKPLAHYTERFRHVPSNSGTVKTINQPSTAPNNWYYSWDAGLVHYIAMSTELYFGSFFGKSKTVKDQYEWMEADLIKANKNRKNVPWIVVHGHRSIYCSCDKDCDEDASRVRNGNNGTYGMEDLLFKYGVDFFINGHEHDYERSWPIYKGKSDQSNINPKATIYVVSGSAGSHELHEPFTRLQPKWSSFRSNTFGYSKMTVHNYTHLHWQQIQTDPTFFGPDKYGRVIDDTWIVQENHGPFSISDAPSNYCPPSGCKAGISIDHWLPFLESGDQQLNAGGDNVSSLSSEYTLLKKYREHNGAGQWKRTELNLLANEQAALGKDSLWEDVRADGNSDGRWADFPWESLK